MAGAVILLSSGLDSTVNFVAALKQYEIRLALTFDYGQRAAAKEIESSKKIASLYKVQHKVIDLNWFQNFTKTSLVNKNVQVPLGPEVLIDDLSTSLKTASSVWVPNRNGIFFNIAAAFAEGLGADFVISGFNAEEAKTFPDNSKEYLQALSLAFSFSTKNQVKALSLTADMDKTEVVALGKTLNAPFDLMWSCYLAGSKMCGECESCKRFFRAVSA
jgi:7-cyano-7-deazaguanine synthase